MDATQDSRRGIAAEEGAAHGYIKKGDKEKLQNRLKRIEGQVRGIQRMVDEEAYCVDILTQIGASSPPRRRWQPSCSRTT